MYNCIRTVGLRNKLHEVDPLLLKFEVLSKCNFRVTSLVIISSISHSDVSTREDTAGLVRLCALVGVWVTLDIRPSQLAAIKNFLQEGTFLFACRRLVFPDSCASLSNVAPIDASVELSSRLLSLQLRTGEVQTLQR